MKKFLSLILAILMITSTVPMAMATGETTTPEAKKALFDAIVEVETKGHYNCYITSEDNTYKDVIELKKKVWSAYTEAMYVYDYYYEANLFDDHWMDIFVNHEYLDANPEVVAEITEQLTAISKEIDKVIEENNAYVVINTTDFVTAIYNIRYNVTEEGFWKIALSVGGDINIANEKGTLADESWSSGRDLTIDIPYIEEEDATKHYSVMFTQTKFNSGATFFIEYATNVYNCFRNIHILKTAKDNLDGTHTGTCDFCWQDVTEEHTYGEWSDDYDNMTSTRKCSDCENIDTEVIEPDTPDEPDTPNEPNTPNETDKEKNFWENIRELIRLFLELLKSFFNNK